MNLDLHPSAVTKIQAGFILLVALSLIVSQANAVCGAAFEVRVQMKLFEPRTGESLKDYSGVVVWLAPLRTVLPASLNSELPHYRVIQRNKTFEPHLLVVPVGSIVDFQNRDLWVHNAFSLFDGVRFDLGPERPGVQKAVRFDHAGVTYVFCGLHPQMGAVVLAIESPYFGVPDKTGHISIGNVPPGTYSLHVWYENAAWQALKGLRPVIVLGNTHRRTPTIFITLAKQVPINSEN
jgi:hypothetical protein